MGTEPLICGVSVVSDLNGIVGHAFGVEDLLESSGEGKHLLNGTLSMKSENTAEQYLVQNLDYR